MQLENCSPEFQRIFERYKKSVRYSKPETLGKSIDRLLQERNKKALLRKDEYDLFYNEAMQEFQSKIDGSFNSKAMQLLTGQKNPNYNQRKTISKNILLNLMDNSEDYLETEEYEIKEKFNRQLITNKTIISNKSELNEKKDKFLLDSSLNHSSKKFNKLKALIEDIPKLKQSVEKKLKEEHKHKTISQKNKKRIQFKEPSDTIISFKENDKYNAATVKQENINKFVKTLNNIASNKDTTLIMKLIDKHKKLENNMQNIKKYESQIINSNQISLDFIKHSEMIKKRLQNKYKRVMEKHFS